MSQYGGKIVPDGSLPDNGFEVNSAPASGQTMADQIRDISGALARDGAEISTACGFHVHVDARDFTHNDIVRLIRLYARLEDALFLVVSASRQSNRFCERCADQYTQRLKYASTDRGKVAWAVYQRSSEFLDVAKQDKYREERYCALNIHSWVYRGTIECRLHQGTINRERIVNWCALWCAIVDFAKSGDIDSLPADSWQALAQVAPSDTVRDWLVSRKLRFINPGD